MIYTVTTNPSVDYYMYMPDFKMGELNRAQNVSIVPGGKGINVSILLTRLGIENIAIGFEGGIIGRSFRVLLREQGLHTDLIHLQNQNTRLNVKVYSQTETQLNAPGPEISQKKLQQLENKVKNMTSNDTLIIGGSLPASVDNDYYAHLLNIANKSNIATFVDSDGQSLQTALTQKPWVVKPNLEELREVTDKDICSKEDVIFAVQKIQQMGAKNVLASMGKYGAVFLSQKGEIFSCGVPKGNLLCTVGSGDSMIAGFIAGWQRTNTIEYALQTAVAIGSATAYSKWLADSDDLEKYLELTPKSTKLYPE